VKIALVSVQGSALPVRDGLNSSELGRHVGNLAGALAGLGHEVTVYTRQTRRAQRVVVPVVEGYQVVHLSAGPCEPLSVEEVLPYLNDFVHALVTRIRLRPVDVLHAHSWVSGLVSALAGRRRSVPVVQSYHGLGIIERQHAAVAGGMSAGTRGGGSGGVATRGQGGSGERESIERAVGRSVRTVLATCGEEVLALSALGVHRSKTVIVPHGADVDRFSPDGPVAARGARHRVVSVGRMTPHAGFGDLIDALPAVPDTELVLVRSERDTPAGVVHAQDLHDRAATLGVADRVRLVGPFAPHLLAQMLRSADLVSHVPWFEPSGTTVLEAMACNVAVLATAVGQHVDSVVDGITGVLTPPRDPRALAANQRRLLADSYPRMSFAAAGCDRARVRYAWNRVATETAAVYQACLGDKSEAWPERERSR